MKILFISLGCDKNLADSEEMLGLLTAVFQPEVMSSQTIKHRQMQS